MIAGAREVSSVEALDLELARLARSQGAVRLRLGEVLEALAADGQHKKLGFSSVKAYCAERIGVGARWAGDSRALARRLEELALVRAALRVGMIGWAKAEVIARVATAENEVVWLGKARCSSVRGLKAAVAEEREEPTEREDAFSSLVRSLDRRDLWAWEGTRWLIEAMDGSRSVNGVVEAVLAEAQVELMDRGLAVSDGEAVGERASREERPERYVPQVEPVVDGVDGPIPDGMLERDAELVQLGRRLATRDLALGEAARRFFGARGWRRLGYGSEQHYCRDRLGMSWSGLKARMTLSRRVARLPEVAEALEAGAMGFEAAALVARVATRATVDAWVARAGERTFKHLREEVEAAELRARVVGDTDAPGPPDMTVLDEVHDMERQVLTGAFADRDGQMFGASGSGLQPGVGTATLTLHVREDLAAWWRELESVHAARELPGSFVGWACGVVWRSWRHTLGSGPKYYEVYVRDRFRCSSPVCERRDVTPHHVQLRSRGGPDTPPNTASLCSCCHLELVHDRGSLKVSGTVGRLGWSSPVWAVEGRSTSCQNECGTRV